MQIFLGNGLFEIVHEVNLLGKILIRIDSSRTVDDLEAIWQRSVETGQSLMKSIFLGFTRGTRKVWSFPQL